MMVNSSLKGLINFEVNCGVNYNYSFRLPTLKQKLMRSWQEFVEEKGLTVPLLTSLSIFVFNTIRLISWRYFRWEDQIMDCWVVGCFNLCVQFHPLQQMFWTVMPKWWAKSFQCSYMYICICYANIHCAFLNLHTSMYSLVLAYSHSSRNQWVWLVMKPYKLSCLSFMLVKTKCL